MLKSGIIPDGPGDSRQGGKRNQRIWLEGENTKMRADRTNPKMGKNHDAPFKMSQLIINFSWRNAHLKSVDDVKILDVF